MMEFWQRANRLVNIHLKKKKARLPQPSSGSGCLINTRPTAPWDRKLLSTVAWHFWRWPFFSGVMIAQDTLISGIVNCLSLEGHRQARHRESWPMQPWMDYLDAGEHASTRFSPKLPGWKQKELNLLSIHLRWYTVRAGSITQCRALIT